MSVQKYLLCAIGLAIYLYPNLRCADHLALSCLELFAFFCQYTGELDTRFPKSPCSSNMAEALSYSTATTASYSGQRREFRKLLCDISEKLDDNIDVKKIKFISDITSENVRTGLDVLAVLEKQGVFSPSNTNPLAELLCDINRKDLADNVRAYHDCAYRQSVSSGADETIGEEALLVKSKPVSRASSLSLPGEPTPTHRRLTLRRWQTMTHGSVAVTLSGRPGENSPGRLSGASSRSEVNIFVHMPPSPALSEPMLSSDTSGELLTSNPLPPTLLVHEVTQFSCGHPNDSNDEGLVMACGEDSSTKTVPFVEQLAGSSKLFAEESHERRGK